MKQLYLLFFIFHSIFSFSQKTESDKKIDSLLVVLNTKREDTAKVNVYQAICEYYGSNDKAVFYNNKILQLSKKNNYKRGIGFYYLNLSQMDENIGKDGVGEIKKASTLFLDTHDIRYYLVSIKYLGVALFKTGDTKELPTIINKGLAIGLPTKYYTEIGDLYTLKGLLSFKDTQYKKALEYYKTALFYFNKAANSNENKSELYLYIAFIYTDLGNYKETIRYIDLSNSIEETIGNNLEKALALNKLQRHEEALKILLRNKKDDIAKSENQDTYNSFLIAETYFNLKKYVVATKNVEKLLQKKSNFFIRLSCSNLLASCYIKQKDFLKAKAANDQALLKIDSMKVNIPGTKESAFLSKSEIEEALKNYQTALVYYKKYNKLVEENNAKITENKIHQLQTDFDVLEKESNIRKLKLIELNKSMELNKQRNYLILSSLLLVLSVGFILFVSVLNRNSKLQTKIIESKNVALQKSIKEKETLLKEIHHRVKNNLQLVMSLLNIQAQKSNQSSEDFLEVSKSRILSMALIHENLYQSEHLSKVDIKEYAERLTEIIINTYNNDNTNIQLQIEIDNISFNIQTAIPVGLIINELVNNAFKHAFPDRQKGVITLKIIQKANKYELLISDNGVGIAKVNSKKTLGLKLVEELVFQIDGTLKVENNHGLSYIIQFQENNLEKIDK